MEEYISTHDQLAQMSSEDLCQSIKTFLDFRKAEDIVCIDIRGKSSIADYMVVASGTSQRHLQTTADLLKQHLHESGIKPVTVEGAAQSDWVLLDAGDIIVHLFRPEVRSFYNLEKMWSLDLGSGSQATADSSS
ncbi:MAG: ribosome silencing factor [Alphaproteobacteria bacterium]